MSAFERALSNLSQPTSFSQRARFLATRTFVRSAAAAGVSVGQGRASHGQDAAAADRQVLF